MIKKEAKNVARKRRHDRVRSKISGTSATPRLNVFRSNNGIYVQVIDDETQKTLVSSSSLELKLSSISSGISSIFSISTELIISSTSSSSCISICCSLA